MSRQDALTDAIQHAVERAGVAQTPDDAATVAASVMAQVRSDPVLKNQMGLEHPIQSRIQWLGSGGVVLSLSVLLKQVGECGIAYSALVDCYNTDLLFTSIGTLAIAAGTLWARFWPGLKPLFSRGMGEG